MRNKHPIQPLELVDGILRFKANKLVRILFETHPTMDLNRIACMDFSDEDREQLSQLMGGSFSYCGDLPYFSTATLHIAKAQYDRGADPRDARIEQLEAELAAIKKLLAPAVSVIYDIHPDDLK